MVKNPPAMRETWVQSLAWEDPLEEGTATLSGILAWRIPMDRGAWWASVYGVTKSRTQLSDYAQHTEERILNHVRKPNQDQLVEVILKHISI